jgi:two-component system heavy metal sensor histidine kinase CusS
VTGFLLVRRGLLPVQALAAQVDAVALGRPGLRLDGAGQPLELRPLVDRFNALLMRVERAYAQLEGFNADVAHELRTPLTTLIGSSELALQRDRPAAELQDVIAETWRI